jgi:hypothetical protein
VSASAGIGVCSCLVSRSRGLDGAALLKGLQLFAAHRERLKQHLEHAEEQEQDQEQQHQQQQHQQQRAMEAVSHVVGTAVAVRQHRSGVVSGVPVDGGGGGSVGVAGAGGAGVAEGQWGMDDESFSEVLAIFAEGRFGPGTMHASWDDEEDDDVNGGGRGVVSDGGAGGGFFGFPGKGQDGWRGVGRLAARVDLCVGEDSSDWEGRAALLLQEARPRLVVLDLDYTVSESESE